MHDSRPAEGRSSAEDLAALFVSPPYPATELLFAEADGDVRRSAAQLAAEIDRLAGGLQRLGVRAGDVVAVQLPTSQHALVAFAAVLRLHATLLAVVDIYGSRELDHVLRDSGAVALVVRDAWRGRRAVDVVAALSGLPALRSVIVVGSAEGNVVGTSSWNDLVSGQGVQPELVEPSPADAAALLLYTSGTTAAPKGVQHDAASLLAEVHSIAEFVGEGPDSRPLQVFPAGHIGGVTGLLRGLVAGTAGVYLESWDPHRAAELIERERLTFCAGAPVHLTMLLDAAEQDGRDLTSLRGFMTGAATVPPALVQRTDAVGFATYRCYGSTEHPTVTSGRPEDPLDKRAFTDGRPLPGNELRIVDDEGHDVAAGAEGEVVSRGPELFRGYRDSRLDAEAFLPGGWYRSGDIGRIDAEGYLAITDRKKDVIIRGGENISSREVEDVLEEHPAVVAAAAVAEPDPRYGERVCAFVVLRPGTALDLDEMRVHFRASGTAVQKTPERIIVVDELPRTPAGKIKKAELRAQLRA
ncbi:MAG: hypothetical protein QOE84_2156 [Actinomycetota bacterium]|nr:hypothetical protein [Actinomycetota bacterium]